MKEIEFEQNINLFIQNLADLIENRYPDLEIEIYENILYIISNTGQYVISKHTPTKQLWISSPISGAHHFCFNDQLQTWTNTRSMNITANKFIEQELNDTEIFTPKAF